jgi:hypothetical protein
LLVISFTGLRLILFMMVDLFDGLSSFGKSTPIVAGADTRTLGTWNADVVREIWTKIWDLHRAGVLAASVVHLWLPAFAMLAYMLRVLNRWLRRREHYNPYVRRYLGEHPVLTLGILAGAVSCALVKLILNTILA